MSEKTRCRRRSFSRKLLASELESQPAPRLPWPSRIFVSAIALLVAGSCRSRPSSGSPCRIPDQLACVEDDRALVCESGVWAEVPCRGAKGCSRSGEADDCDDTIAVEGDRCPKNPAPDYACTADRARALICVDGHFSVWRECRGPLRCEIGDGRNLRCDTTLAEPGDRCAPQGAYCCSVDKSSMLVCDGRSLFPASSCRGPRACRAERETGKVDCDDTVAIEGDACDEPKRIACSLDHRAELACVGKRYEKKRECRRSECKLDGNELFCD
jgi:hypothetical protein